MLIDETWRFSPEQEQRIKDALSVGGEAAERALPAILFTAQVYRSWKANEREKPSRGEGCPILCPVTVVKTVVTPCTAKGSTPVAIRTRAGTPDPSEKPKSPRSGDRGIVNSMAAQTRTGGLGTAGNASTRPPTPSATRSSSRCARARPALYEEKPVRTRAHRAFLFFHPLPLR
jgi:hypothetical protein